MNSAESIEAGTREQRGFELKTLGRWAREAGPLIALLLLIIIGQILNPNFLRWDNVTNVLTRSAFVGIISVGATFVIVTGQIDLSVGAMAAFIAGLMIIVINRLAEFGVGQELAIVAGMVIGLVVGLISGLANGFLSVSYTHLTLPTICSV